MKTLALAGVLGLLAACAQPLPAVDEPVASVDQQPVTAPPQAAAAEVADQLLPDAQAAIAPSIDAPILAAQELVQALADPDPPLPPPPEPAEAACRRAAASLIVRWEVTSEAYYNRRLLMPIWPKGQSGVTWGIGYDGGAQTARTIRQEWVQHASVERLAKTAGISGNRAGAVLTQYRDILTPYGYAFEVFEDSSLIEYLRLSRRAFPEGFDELRPKACAALVSLVYNRGSAMTGDSRKEMRTLRDECVPKQDYSCIAHSIRSMSRLWRGTVNEAGLTARRESEAALAEME